MTQPENKTGWASATAKNLDQTKAHTSNVRAVLGSLAQFEATEIAKLQDPQAAKKNAAEIQSIDERIEEVKESIKKVGFALHRLQHEFKSKWGYLKVNEQRQEMRQQRPVSEVFKDNVEEALEAENKALTDARAELQAQTTEVKQVQKELEAAYDFLLRDVTHKRVPTRESEKNGEQKFKKSLSLPNLFKTGHSYVPLQEEDPAFQGRSIQEVMKISVQREARALQASKKANASIEKISDSCAKATIAVTKSFEKRSSETKQLKIKLQEQVFDADATIKEAEQTISRIRRNNRVESSEKDEKLTTAEAGLAQLKESRKQLNEDLRCKTASLRIDQACVLLSAGKTEARNRGQRGKTNNASPPLTNSANDEVGSSTQSIST